MMEAVEPNGSSPTLPTASPKVLLASKRSAQRRASRRGSSEPVTMSGWLSKRAISGRFKNWRDRFFTIQGTKVQYRKSQLAPPRGTIQLESGTAVKAYPEFGPFCFCCQTNSVCLYAKAKDEAELQSWIAAINAAIPSDAASPKSPEAEKEAPEAAPVKVDSKVAAGVVAPSGLGWTPTHTTLGASPSLLTTQENSAAASPTAASPAEASAAAAAILEAECAKPMDASDVSDFASAKAEVARLRALALLSSSYPPAGTPTDLGTPVPLVVKKPAAGQKQKRMTMHNRTRSVLEMGLLVREQTERLGKAHNDNFNLEDLKQGSAATEGAAEEEAVVVTTADGLFASKIADGGGTQPAAATVAAPPPAPAASAKQVVQERIRHRAPLLFGSELKDNVKLTKMRRKRKGKKKEKSIKMSFQRVLLKKVHNIRTRARQKRLEEVVMRGKRASVFRPGVVGVRKSLNNNPHAVSEKRKSRMSIKRLSMTPESDGEEQALMTPEQLAAHIQRFGIRTITDALNYEKALQGCPSGSRKASCVCRANPDIIFLYKRRHPAFEITRDDVQKDIELMRQATAAGLVQLPQVYTDVFDAVVDNFETFGFLMGNVPSLMTAPYKPGTSHKATINNMKGRLKLLNFTQLNRAIKDLKEIGEFTRTKYYIHDMQMLLQDEGDPSQIGHVWVIDPGELHPTHNNNQVRILSNICKRLRRTKTTSIIRFMNHTGHQLAKPKKAVAEASAAAAAILQAECAKPVDASDVNDLPSAKAAVTRLRRASAVAAIIQAECAKPMDASDVNDLPSAKVEVTRLRRASAVAAILQAECAKPMDASDVNDFASAKAEVARLRALCEPMDASDVNDLPSAKVEVTRLRRASAVAAIIQAECAKPMDASDVNDFASAKAEVARLRALCA